MKIIVVNGSQRVGKDTFIDFCIDILKENGKFGKKISTIDYVKEVAKFCGWDGRKNDKDRKFLSDLKNVLIEWNDIPFKKVCKEIDILHSLEIKLNNFNYSYLFVLCREPDEIEKIVNAFDTITVLVVNKKAESMYQTSNRADKEVKEYNYDVCIMNNFSLDNLRISAETFLKKEGFI